MSTLGTCAQADTHTHTQAHTDAHINVCLNKASRGLQALPTHVHSCLHTKSCVACRTCHKGAPCRGLWHSLHLGSWLRVWPPPGFPCRLPGVHAASHVCWYNLPQQGFDIPTCGRQHTRRKAACSALDLASVSPLQQSSTKAAPTFNFYSSGLCRLQMASKLACRVYTVVCVSMRIAQGLAVRGLSCAVWCLGFKSGLSYRMVSGF